MTIKFSCPKCGERFAVKDESRGKRGRCSCGAVIRIPSTKVSTSEPSENNYTAPQNGATICAKCLNTIKIGESREIIDGQVCCIDCVNRSHKLVKDSHKPIDSVSQDKSLGNSKSEQAIMSLILIVGIIILVFFRRDAHVQEWIYTFITTNVSIKIILLILNIPIYFALVKLIFGGLKNFWRLEKYSYIPIYYLILSRKGRHMARRDYSAGFFSLKRILLHMLHVWLFTALYLFQYMLIKVIFLK